MATFWVDAYAAPELLKGRARAKYEAMQGTYLETGTSLREDESKWEGRGKLAYRLFKELSDFLVAQHGRSYIILVDEYDQPLEAALRKEWQAKADKAYLGMLMDMFKGNDDLAKGLLVGVHEFKLSDRESGLNSAKAISLTTGCYCIGDAKAAEIRNRSLGSLAALFAFTREDVAALTKRTREVSVAAGVYSPEVIMKTIETWYDGYDFGFPAKRYNPWSVVNFLHRLANGDPIEKAAAPYWVNTGNMTSVAQLAWRHRVEILQLAPLLLRDCRTGAKDSSIRVAGLSGEPPCVLPPGDFKRVNIGMTTYPSSRTDLRSTGELVTLLLHLGYLTMRPGNGVHIPNGEMQVVWDNANDDIMFDAKTDDERDACRAQVVEQLYRGDVSTLVQCMLVETRFLANEGELPEASYANALRLRMGGLFHYNPDVTVINESQSGAGRSDIIIHLDPKSHPTCYNREKLLIIIEMKRITGTGVEDQEKDAAEDTDAAKNAGAAEDTKAAQGTDAAKDTVAAKRMMAAKRRKVTTGKRLALEGLNQIVAKKYARCHQTWPLRLDVGMAVGKGGLVVAHTRWWTWANDETATDGKPGDDLSRREVEDGKHEKTSDWMQWVADIDKTEWRDGLGYVRKRSLRELEFDKRGVSDADVVVKTRADMTVASVVKKVAVSDSDSDSN
ncbi:hypothetical protein IWQ57_000410 [Coemansia nantahalensis]|uniref:Uncharacterized protein n=1 Tax=Coemansia nantahalensis TaxID=2789366 RepID=A0ACC1K838_9FUNG|nr:hypothetical protein IWQ57_000410 [Coemansia nantahalensis]